MTVTKSLTSLVRSPIHIVIHNLCG